MSNPMPRWKDDFPVPSGDDSYATRREFTKFLGLASLAFFAGTFAAAARTLWKRATSGVDEAFEVAGAGEIAVGGYKLFRYPAAGDACILLRLDAEKFVAFNQNCTHLQCPVHFDAAAKQLVCPCHKGFFNAEDGRPLSGPPKRPLAALAVSVRGSRVWVRASKEEEYT